MSKIKTVTPAKIDKYLIDNKNETMISISYGEFDVLVETVMTESNKYKFVERVVALSYDDKFEYSPVDRHVGFVVTFMQMLTNLPLYPLKGDIDKLDVEKMCSVARELEIIEKAKDASSQLDDLLSELELYIDEKIEYRNAEKTAYMIGGNINNDAIEAIYMLADKGLDLVNLAADVLDKLKDGSLLKGLTKPKIDAIFSGINNLFRPVKEKVSEFSLEVVKNNGGTDEIKEKISAIDTKALNKYKTM